MRWRRGGGRAAIAACAIGLLSGCAGSEPGADTTSATPTPATATTAADAGVLLELVQLRGDVAGAMVELRVTNEGDDELVIERAAYASSRWSAPMERVDEARIPPGARRNLQLQLPEPTCDAAPLEHLATLELADGTRVEGVPADPFGQLDALDDAVCDLRAFASEVAAVEWLDPEIPADGSGPAILRLRVSPVAGGGAAVGTIDEVAATVLLAPLDASAARIEALPVGLAIATGTPATVVDVPLTPGRCDLHAVAEDKQGTIFRVRATQGGERVDLLLPSPEAQRKALLDWAVARCAALP
ncbi:hypothetical protein [Agrococcus beijingensis]|uniref:hypothetical protein n=1 Tax=Agrococcus beijingensis TaxID=3068634 RepID=UPI0027422DC7|nr:hypothetical protein [Agrococcus sp. REN33]